MASTILCIFGKFTFSTFIICNKSFSLFIAIQRMVNRNSHSVVTANSALLIRGSHSVTSSQIGEAYIEQRFAFGGSGRIEFVTDTDFYNTPFKMCLQITQPKFNIR